MKGGGRSGNLERPRKTSTETVRGRQKREAKLRGDWGVGNFGVCRLRPEGFYP